MNKTETLQFLDGIARNFKKNAGIFKTNTLNNTERIIRKNLGGEVECTVFDSNNKIVPLRAVSVPYTPPKQKDQTFHRLELYVNDSGVERLISDEELDLDAVLNLYDAIWTIAREQAENKQEE